MRKQKTWTMIRINLKQKTTDIKVGLCNKITCICTLLSILFESLLRQSKGDSLDQTLTKKQGVMRANERMPRISCCISSDWCSTNSLAWLNRMAKIVRHGKGEKKVLIK
jgi:hypothetical protein